METQHERFMREAMNEAKKAAALGEVPIGAVIVRKGEIVGRGYNLRETQKDPTLHAEMIAIREASQKLGGWRLIGCDLYVTLEPCPMCAGAIVQSRIEQVYYGATDPKAGCAGTLMNLCAEPRFNHQVPVWAGILQEECQMMLKDFFRQLRKKKKEDAKNISLTQTD
ncbi:tRNA adenosine(34) deaminase TadA [Brevibacillus laterosporus]|uniref:tRNA adenosine(34) deaminase TadA n=1 Tax=Brevibacillus laterosporus TaxID=1465 RepID=UPI000BC8BD09|nr:tRNA adenosine(34) deaminase TadA [Brevibacillus laterosporus]PCN42987.1 tRNA adenosine(34) deaminase TadA [Brevibacillus laterosporus]